MLRPLPIALIAALVGGCATMTPQVNSAVTTFHNMPVAGDNQATYSVVAWRKDNENSLEFAAYAQQLTDALRMRGLNVVKPGERATHAIYLDYGIDNGRVETSTYSIPQWGVTGYNASNTYGTVNRVGNTAYVNATTYQTPTYGVTGYSQGTTSTRVFKRFVNMDIVEIAALNGAGKKIYQGQLKSEGTCDRLTELMPVFISALTQEFPGQNGATRGVLLPWSGNC